MLDIVMLRPRTAPRTSLGTSESAAISAGRPAALANEYTKPSATDRVTPGRHSMSGRPSAAVTVVTTEMVRSMAHGSRASAPGARTFGKRESFTPGGPREARVRL
jgi:hypothetical protein